MERLQSHVAFVDVIKQRHKVVSKDLVVHYYLVPPTLNTGKKTIPQAATTPGKLVQDYSQQCFRRLGLAVSKKVGNAVVRNKVKRRFRAIAALYEELLPHQCDVVLRARDHAGQANFEDLCKQISQAFESIQSKSTTSLDARMVTPK